MINASPPMVFLYNLGRSDEKVAGDAKRLQNVSGKNIVRV